MSMTAAALAKQVLIEITWLDAVEEPSAADSQLAQDISTRQHAYLRKRNILYWDPSEIPDEIAQYLIRWLACHVAPSFGKSIAEENMTAYQTEQARYSALETAALPEDSGTLLESDYPQRRGGLFNFQTGE
jgi:hypothetical protein